MSAIAEKTILEEIRALREILERIEALLEERLIGVEEPFPDEIKAIKEYEDKKRSDKTGLIGLEEVLRSIKSQRDTRSTLRIRLERN